jgi:hypothetical protein
MKPPISALIIHYLILQKITQKSSGHFPKFLVYLGNGEKNIITGETMNPIYDWLLDGPDWIRYIVYSDLLDIPTDDPLIFEAKKGLRTDDNIRQLLVDIEEFDTILLKRHNDAKHPLHKLAFLSELGFRKEDPEIKRITSKILNHQSINGPFQVLSNYPTHFGGSGLDEWLWALCDAPTLSYALLRFGYGDDERVMNSIDHMVGLITNNGWPCAVASTLGKFKGPGKKTDPCPYANLIMLKLLSELPFSNFQEALDIGIETLLNLWENSLEQRPFLFRMGTDFRKLKVPFIWYDILHVAEVLSRFPQCRKDKRFLEIIEVILSKSDEEGKYKSESIWTKWKGWEFCQKREPSRWITLCILRIQKRISSE